MLSAHSKTSLLSLALLFVVACGAKAQDTGTTTPAGTEPTTTDTTGAADKPPTMPLTGAPEDLLRLFEGLATQVKASGSDCAKYATVVKTWVDANATRYEQLRAKVEGMQLPSDEEQQFDSRLAEAMGVIVSGASTCGDNDKAWAAFKSFDGLIEGS